MLLGVCNDGKTLWRVADQWHYKMQNEHKPKIFVCTTESRYIPPRTRKSTPKTWLQNSLNRSWSLCNAVNYNGDQNSSDSFSWASVVALDQLNIALALHCKWEVQNESLQGKVMDSKDVRYDVDLCLLVAMLVQNCRWTKGRMKNRKEVHANLKQHHHRPYLLRDDVKLLITQSKIFDDTWKEYAKCLRSYQNSSNWQRKTQMSAAHIKNSSHKYSTYC